MCMSHVTLMNESFHPQKITEGCYVILHIKMRHVTHSDGKIQMIDITHMIDLCHTYE